MCSCQVLLCELDESMLEEQQQLIMDLAACLQLVDCALHGKVGESGLLPLVLGWLLDRCPALLPGWPCSHYDLSYFL